MTGGGYAEAGCGPDETVAAEYAGFPKFVDACGVAGSDAGAGGNVDVNGGGTAAGPMPGPIAFTSCLETTLR